MMHRSISVPYDYIESREEYDALVEGRENNVTIRLRLLDPDTFRVISLFDIKPSKKLYGIADDIVEQGNEND